MTKKKILFIDDEPNILSGLKRMLRSLRKEFHLEFTESGRKALEIMEKHNFDVVVSDMRMPGMDGATLLAEIQKRFPYSIRIMLSGQANEESIMRTVGVVHQFLAKPCDPEYLKAVLLRVCALHDLMAHPCLREMVSQLDTLPSLPEVYAKLRQAIANPEVPVSEIAAIIEEDMAMSAKVLQLVNSAFFGLFQKVESPARAVNLLGIDTVKNLILGVGAFTEIKASSKIFPVKKLWSHSLMVGNCAKIIARAQSEDNDLIDNSFIAGLLHDIGKLVMLAKMDKQYEEATLLAGEEGICLRSAEKRIFNAVHDDFGAYLMGLWGMPGPVIEAIGFHHRLDNYPDNQFSPTIAVHLANAFYYEKHPDTITTAPHAVNISHLKTIGLGDKIEPWRELCSVLLEQEDET